MERAGHLARAVRGIDAVTDTYDFGSTGGGAWPAAVHAALSARGVRLLAHVPDGGNAALIARCEAAVPIVSRQEATMRLCCEGHRSIRCQASDFDY